MTRTASLILAAILCGATPCVEAASLLAKSDSTPVDGEGPDARYGELRPIENAGGISLFVAMHKTGARRVSDFGENRGWRRDRSVSARARVRMTDDVNFTNRAKFLARRAGRQSTSFYRSEVTTARTGEEFVDALISASRRGPISNLVIYGHAHSSALYMMEDRGFYVSVGTVAKHTHLAAGNEAERISHLRAIGARDLTDLEQLVRRGEVSFANGAIVVFAGCAVAGKRTIVPQNIAWQIARIANATVIASLGVTDQSMASGANFRNNEYSRGSWVRFTAEVRPENLKVKAIDVLKHLRANSG
jgi:hypothetical protein